MSDLPFPFYISNIKGRARAREKTKSVRPMYANSLCAALSMRRMQLSDFRRISIHVPHAFAESGFFPSTKGILLIGSVIRATMDFPLSEFMGKKCLLAHLFH
ncbi:MAG: hypothetical protein K6F32_03110 [Bacilli bacterium]|nr:hypothetical protein [Bacilli bacterium]